MNEELTRKLVQRFPVIYQGFYDNMSETCMCWGFECGDGWFPIIWQLSLAIESELGYTQGQIEEFLWNKKWSKRWNALIYKLSPVQRDKQERRGTGSKDDPIHWVVTEKAKGTWDERLVRFLFGQKEKRRGFDVDRLGLKRLVWHPNTGFAVSQVKEKFGGLRFYCPGNERINQYVNFAEHLAEITCEECGKPGKLRERRGWLATECDACARPQSVLVKSS